MNTKSVIVVGAGMGGLTSAIHLAKQGLKVTVVEKNSRPGGRCDRISRDGHHFDTGPTLMVMPLLFEAEFEALGIPINKMLDLQRVDPTYHLVFDDGNQLALTSDLKALQEQLEVIEPGSFQGLLRYMDEGHRHYHLGVEKLVYPDFRKASDFFKIENLPLLYQVKPLANHYANMSAYFNEPRLKAAFTFQDVYMGLSPFEAPATFSMMSYTELAHGVWYPKGGMYSIVEALYELAIEAGVKFAFDTTVQQIDVDGGYTRGVIVGDGSRLDADVVLANADLSYVHQKLLPQNGDGNRMARKRHSCSVISFFWGVDKRYEELPPHTLFLADNYRENFDSIIDDLGLPDNPSLYVHAPARLDASMAPEGQDTLIAIVPVGHMSENGNQDWVSMREKARQDVFRRLRMLGVNDLEDHIKFEMNFTPLSWRKRYNLAKGSTHGLCHNLTQLGYFRPDYQHPRYENLYFVGASTRPGTGMPTAMVSGRQAANRILNDLRIAV
ncbi:MAG: phytoene desaturase [Chloroflexi bacterium]|nr:MAG: phytoene desaturase [Chloroflexota bacterium]MBL1193740.1 phytoene desaturase [Chloroflexota bacterium]NOH11033.1 phytoene desaturase [Chloroflexota bacterium]